MLHQQDYRPRKSGVSHVRGRHQENAGGRLLGAFLPGTGVPEIGGLIPRDVQVILRSLRGKEIVGADISEVSPCFDPTGMTCITVANLMFEMLCVTADYIDANR